MEIGSASKRISLISALVAGLALSGCASMGSSSSNSAHGQKSEKASTEKTSKKAGSKASKKIAKKTSDKSENAAAGKKPRTLMEWLEAKSNKSLSKKNAAKANASKEVAKKEVKSKSAKTAEKKAKAATKTIEKNTTLARLPSTIDATGPVTRTGEVYLFRGLANVFSRGMDEIGRKMVRSGLDARVYNHAAWTKIASNIIARNRKKQVNYPIIIMGHSLGANASTQMARYLGDRGIPVTYVVAFDPTITTYVGKNVKQVTNYYLPNDDKDNIVVKKDGFTGRLRNVDMSHKGVNHFVIEKNGKLQRDSIEHVLRLTKKLDTSRS